MRRVRTFTESPRRVLLIAVETVRVATAAVVGLLALTALLPTGAARVGRAGGSVLGDLREDFGHMSRTGWLLATLSQVMQGGAPAQFSHIRHSPFSSSKR